ncbi:hypothetical protein D9M71_641900 [compost metagenome]
MQDSSLGQVGLGQHRQGIGARLAGMHDHRLAGLPRRLEMQAESGLLQGCRFGLVVVVQAGLADGDHPRVVQFAQQPVEHRLAARLEIQRVHADRAIHVVVGFCQTAHRRGVVGTHADAQEAADAAAACRRQRGVQGTAVGREVQAVEMAVGIYESHHIVRVGRSDLRAPAR